VRLQLLDAQSFHQPAILLRRQLTRCYFRPRPLESSAFQTLVQQQKAVAFPIQCLDAITASAAEEKQRVCEWIQTELLLYHGSQAIYSAPDIIASTIFCLQFDVPGWHESLADPILADSICDRIVCNSHMVTIKSKSMRKLAAVTD